MNGRIRDIMAVGETYPGMANPSKYASFKGRKPGSKGLKGLNAKGILDRAKQMYANDGEYNIQLNRECRDECPHVGGVVSFDRMTSSQQKNVAKRLYSKAQQRVRASRFKTNQQVRKNKEASPGAGYGVLRAGGPGSGRHKGESQSKSVSVANKFGYNTSAAFGSGTTLMRHHSQEHSLQVSPNGSWTHTRFSKNGASFRGEKSGQTSSELKTHLTKVHGKQ